MGGSPVSPFAEGFAPFANGEAGGLGLRGWDRDNLWDKGFFRQVLSRSSFFGGQG